MTTPSVSAFSTTLQLLERTVAERALCTGIQAFAECGGTVLIDSSCGTTHRGEQMQVDTLHPSWCLTKPLLSLAIGHLLDEGQLSLATTVRSLGLSIPLAVQESVTVGDLLNHSAGLRHPLMIGWRITPEGKRPSLLRAADNRAVPRIVYSEIAAGLVVEEIVAQLTGIDAAIFVRRRILEPLGLETEILIDRATACDPRIMARLRVPVSTTLENRSVATLEK